MAKRVLISRSLPRRGHGLMAAFRPAERGGFDPPKTLWRVAQRQSGPLQGPDEGFDSPRAQVWSSRPCRPSTSTRFPRTSERRPMDQDQEFKRAKWLLGAAGIFLISAFMSFDEFRYKIWSRTTDGRVLQARATEEIGRRGNRRPMLSVEYTFRDEARGPFTERDLVPVDTQLPPDGRVPIQYIPGSPDSSRLSGHSNSTWVIVFFASLAIMAFFLLKLAREANEPPSRPRTRRAN